VRQLKQYQVVDWLKQFCQRHWLPILLGIVATIAVLGISQQLQQAELLAGVQSPLLKVVRFGGLAGAWTLACMVYLGQRSERYVRQAQKINQQLQAEINERRQIEIELRRSEAANHNLSDRLALAVQSAQIGIWDWDIINDCLIWNDQMHALYGVTPSNFSGAYQAWASALHPDDFDRTTTVIQQAIRGERDYDPEFRVVHPDGSVRHIQAHAIVQRDPQGQARRMIGVNLDITDRKQAELALQNSQARFAGILEIASDAIVSINTDQHITLFNKGAERIFGYKAEEVLGQPLAMLIPDRFAHAHPQSVNQYAQHESRTRQMSQRGTIFGQRKDGSEFPAEASISKLNLNGEITFTTFLRDITARATSRSSLKAQ
jgi:PAS domain S-box-containing protein